jgi:MGT family glycosyltransferase
VPRRRLPLLEVDLERERRDLRERFVRRHARARVPEVVRACEAWSADLVVCDEIDYGGMIAAELLGLPHATVLVTAAGSLATADVVAEPLDELRAEHGLPPDPELAVPARHLVLSPFPPSFRDPRFPLPPTAHSFRPGAATMAAPREPPWPVRRPGAPIVYFTLGTEFNVESGDLFSRVLEGLVQLPVNILVTVGTDIDPAELGVLPRHVHAAQFVPQELVLPHVSAVVSHGGSGTVTAALAHGLPQVVVPMRADQPLNAARCEQLGAARALDPVRATPAEAREALDAVLTDPAYGSAAGRLRAEIEALPGPPYAVEQLRRLAAAPGGPGTAGG